MVEKILEENMIETGNGFEKLSISNTGLNMFYQIVFWIYVIGNLWLSWQFGKIVRKAGLVYGSISTVLFVIIGYFIYF